MALRKKTKIREIVIYNFDVRKQELCFLYRGQEIPRELREYGPLWRVTDRTRSVETVIISV